MDDVWSAVCCRDGIPVCEHGYCHDHRDDCDACLDAAILTEVNQLAETLTADILARRGA